jgi:hypothetical protein
MKRLLSVAAAGLMCGGAILGAPGVAGASSTASGPVVEPGGPMVRAAGHAGLPTTSINWSGYAATSKKAFNSVRATWIVPRIKCTGVANQWTSNWVGLDGFNDSTVEQDGTFAGCGGAAHTKPFYTGWIEMFPAPSKRQFWVQAGDTMTASVVFAKGTFTLRITDVTAHKGAVASATCADCKRASAEWIIERPAYCNHNITKCFIAELANFGTTAMAGSKASVAGGPVSGPAAFGSSPIDMIQPLKRGFISLDEVSALSGPSFGAQWQRSGSPVPITLGPKQ